MKKRNWIHAMLAGIIGGLVLATIMSYQDWCLNPGGIFHHQTNGTNWAMVWETWFSWFLPVFLWVTALGLMALFIVSWFKTKRIKE